MNTAQIDKLVTTVLYEGYSLYPYRLCIKNAKRWMFGCVYPKAHPAVRSGVESSQVTTRCLVEGSQATRVAVQVRFLHLLQRQVAWLPAVETDGPQDSLQSREFGFVDSIEIDGVSYDSWQEAVERRIEVEEFALSEAVSAPKVCTFHLGESPEFEIIRSHGGASHGIIVRRQYPMRGTVECITRPVDDGLYELEITVRNESPVDIAPNTEEDDSQLQAFVSTHTILAAQNGRFVSMTDPPEQHREIVAVLQNIGTWPVLVGDEDLRNMMLSSPIILYDFPQVAAETSGDLFDSTEIDEILALRILTLSDDEKRQLRGGEERSRQILERTESLSEEHFRKLHGAIRGLQRVEATGRGTQSPLESNL